MTFLVLCALAAVYLVIGAVFAQLWDQKKAVLIWPLILLALFFWKS